VVCRRRRRPWEANEWFDIPTTGSIGTPSSNGGNPASLSVAKSIRRVGLIFSRASSNIVTSPVLVGPAGSGISATAGLCLTTSAPLLMLSGRYWYPLLSLEWHGVAAGAATLVQVQLLLKGWPDCGIRAAKPMGQ
jgi:hypothetical protein